MNLAFYHGLNLLSFALQLELSYSYENFEYELITKLLSNYNTNVRPVADPRDPVHVTISMAINQLIDVDERNQIITTKAWMRLYWKDVSFTWNASDYGGLSRIRILGKLIWRPDITLYNDVREDKDTAEDHYMAQIRNDGGITWNYPLVIKSTCTLDVQYFPWDLQKCFLKYGSWTYDGTKVNLTHLSSTADDSYYMRSGEWDLLALPIIRHEVTYTCCPGSPYPDVTFWIILKRKPLYYIFNLILPCVILSAINLLVFYLPVESGEKVSLGVTVLLAMTFFLLMVAEAMPPQSICIPLIGWYFGATILMQALSTVMTVVVLNLYHRGVFKYNISSMTRKIILNWMARATFMKEIVDKNLSRTADTKETVTEATIISNGQLEKIKPVSQVGQANANMKPAFENTRTEMILLEILDILKVFQQNHMTSTENVNCQTDWMMAAMVVDRFLLGLNFVWTIFVVMVTLLQTPDYNIEDVMRLL